MADSYYDAWKYTPFLIIGCVYLTLGTFMATSYTVHKAVSYTHLDVYKRQIQKALNLTETEYRNMSARIVAYAKKRCDAENYRCV